jgi:two-component system, NtrC family, response regulator HydG
MPHALIIDDDNDVSGGLAELVASEGFSTATATTLAEAREQLRVKPPDVVLLDLVLPDGNGIDLLRELSPDSATEVIVVTGYASVESSIAALRRGATDYLLKPVNVHHLRSALSRIAKPAELRAEVAGLRHTLRSLGGFGSLVGSSAPMQKLYDAIERVAPTDTTVFITGESGTGKEVVAQTIHDESPRRLQPFLAINCGAISPHLIESELFGHEKGSFTGANRQHRGFFERARGGTLLLDEVTEMPPDLQVKLLRVLETSSLTRVGSDEPIETDVRVLAASNRTPQDAVSSGKLRRDLLYRLHVFPVYVPPLRERTGDVTLLALHFLAELNEGAVAPKSFTPAALERLERYGWPGNVRELWNVVRRAYIMSDSALITQLGLSVEATLNAESSARSFQINVGDRIDSVEKRLILATVQHTQTRETAAAMLGISVKTLYNRLRLYETESNGSGAMTKDSIARTSSVSP